MSLHFFIVLQQTLDSLKNIYGGSEELINTKLERIKELSEHQYIRGLDFSIARAPGRISFSKHCDYVNNDLMYFADDRDTMVAVSSQTGIGDIRIANLDSHYESYKINASLIDDYCANLNPKSWLSYPISLLKVLRDDYDLDYDSIDLNILVSSEIPAAGGLSSSHALLLAMLIATAQQLQSKALLDAISAKDISILKLLQKVENTRGFNSGLGDPAAQMLAQCGKFVLVKLEPELKYSYLDIPDEMLVITAPSFIHADKSLPEFAEANANIAAYKELNNLAQKLFKHPHVKYIGDAIDFFSEAELIEAINCIDDFRLKGLAIYALAEGSRLREIKLKAPSLSSEEFLCMLGKHLNLSHQAERIKRSDNMQFEKGLYEINKSKNLSEHSGYYGASTSANDELQSLALSLKGVYGSSISGAGLGGNNIILIKASETDNIIQTLVQKYYAPKGLESKLKGQLHISRSSAGAALVFATAKELRA